MKEIKYVYEILVLDTKKLQIKYKTLKKKWREMIDCFRKGSRLAPVKLQTWCYTLEAALGDINIKPECIALNPHDTPYGQLSLPCKSIIKR